METQDQWHFCQKCFGMFYNGDQQGHRGRCPAGGGHEAHGFNFVLPHTWLQPNSQGNWRFCSKCFGMFYGGDPNNSGRCPAGGEHEMYGLVFALPHDIPEGPGTQQQWRFCDKCFGLFYNGDPQHRKGRCSAGEGHQAQGFNFVLPHTAEFIQGPAGTVGAPHIDVGYTPHGQVFTITGQSFLPNHAIHVRFVNHAAVQNPAFFNTTSDGLGRINNFPISFPINVPQTYGISANDERRSSSDTLWSNTVTITAT